MMDTNIVMEVVANTDYNTSIAHTWALRDSSFDTLQLPLLFTVDIFVQFTDSASSMRINNITVVVVVCIFMFARPCPECTDSGRVGSGLERGPSQKGGHT
jgi:hypothetical protein